MQEPQGRRSRPQVPEHLTWNLADIYATEVDWETDLNRVEEDLAAVGRFRGRLGEGAAVLLECLRARDGLLERMGRVGAYANLHVSADGASPTNQVRASRAGALSARVEAALSFITDEIGGLNEDVLAAFFREEPDLEPYRSQTARILRRRPHQLPPETEESLAALGQTLQAPATVYRRTMAADAVFPPIKDEQGRAAAMSPAGYGRYAQSMDREVRRQAYASLNEGLGRHRHTLAACLAACVERNVTLARLRRYDSSAELFLKPQEVPLEVYHKVLDVVHDEAAPHVRRFNRLRRRVLGVDRLQRWDLNAPLDPEYNPACTFEEAGGMIKQALRPLGEEYAAILDRAFAERWVDLADNAGKSGGAFCSTVYGVHSYILMTWQDKMRDAFVLAHELGHAGHGMLASRNQVISGARAGRFFIEAPSTLNELLLGHFILDTTDDPRMRRWVILQFLGTFWHNMVNHLLEGRLERRLYELAEAGRPLTASVIMAAQGEVFENFFGDTLVIDEGARLNWMLVPHFYVGLYPFTYAAGLSCAYNVVEAVRTEGEPAVQRWLDALRAGGTLSPLELAGRAGVDMADPGALHRAVAFFGELVDQLEASFA